MRKRRSKGRRFLLASRKALSGRARPSRPRDCGGEIQDQRAVIVRKHRVLHFGFRGENRVGLAWREPGHGSGGGREGEVAVVALVEGFDKVVAGAAESSCDLVMSDAGLASDVDRSAGKVEAVGHAA